MRGHETIVHYTTAAVSHGYSNNYITHKNSCAYFSTNKKMKADTIIRSSQSQKLKYIIPENLIVLMEINKTVYPSMLNSSIVSPCPVPPLKKKKRKKTKNIYIYSGKVL